MKRLKAPCSFCDAMERASANIREMCPGCQVPRTALRRAEIAREFEEAATKGEGLEPGLAPVSRGGRRVSGRDGPVFVVKATTPRST